MSSSPRTTQKPKSAEARGTGGRRRNTVARSQGSRSGRAAPSGRAAAGKGRSQKSDALQVTFWGVRGSIPAPGSATRRFGGNTPCVEVRFGDQLVIFDLGSGARGLGDSLDPKGVQASIFVSHYHYDHLQGLPFFSPMFNPNHRFTFWGPTRNGLGVREILAGQMVQPYFPVTAEMVFRASVDYRELVAGEEVPLGEGVLRSLELNHPGGNLGYRIDFKGKSVVYATDIEHGAADFDERFFEFARGADLLIYDAMYTDDEYHGREGSPKAGWGHSTWQAAVRAADRSGAKKLVLFHHEPTRDDAGMEKLLRAVRKLRPEAEAARESMTLRA